MNRKSAILIAAFAVLGASSGLVPAGRQALDLELVKRVTVPGNPGWVDTGLEVAAGEEFHIVGSGEITLQRGNPSADCGPQGLDLMTVQQPIPSQNIGALIGKVAELISVRKDEDSGQEIRDEIVRYFFIGAESDVAMPISGRLSVGVNENVLKDNGGEFTVAIYRRAG
jgi:hypothetical protein